MMPTRLMILMLASLVAGAAVAGDAGNAIRSLPVPADTIDAGDVITAQQLTGRQFQTSARSLAGIATADEQIIGKQARRRLSAGKPVSLSAVETPMAVKRGKATVASYTEDGFSISTPVIAMEDGAPGDVIDVRTAETGVVIKAEVLDGGALAVVGE